MGKFSNIGRRVPKTALAGFNPYDQSLREIQKVEEKTAPAVIPGAAADLPAGPAPAPVGAPGVVDTAVAETPSPVLQAEQISTPKTRDELVQATQEQGAFDERTGEYQSLSREEAEAAVDDELGQQQTRGYQDLDLNFRTASELQAQIKNTSNSESKSKTQADSVIAKGRSLGVSAGKVFDSSINIQSNAQAKNFLQKYNLLNNEGKVDPRLGNALAIAIPKLIKEDKDKRSKEQDKTGSGVDDPWSDSDLSGNPSFDPNLTQGNLIREIANIINPNSGDQGFYSPDQRGELSREAGSSEVEAGLWKALFDADMLETYNPDPRDPKNVRYRWSSEAIDYYGSVQDIMQAINPKQTIQPSSTPAFGGKTYGKELLSKSAKEISIKSQVDKNQKIEQAVKDTLGRMPMKINAELASMSARMWQDVNNSYDDRGVSTSPYAEVFNLGEKKYAKIKAKEESRIPAGQEIDPGVLQDTLKRRMEEEAKKIGDTFNAIQEWGGDTFYNKWFHAAANGRYHVLNSVLNPQDSKFVRNIVSNALTVQVNPNDKGSKLNENFRYIVVRNLMPNIHVDGKPESIENVGWERTLQEFDRNIAGWARTGEILSDPNHPEHAKTLKDVMDSHGIDNENWGFVLQSFFDAAKYKSGKPFDTKVRVQHDGKQNGLAIQAVQTGDLDLMRKIGLVYDDDMKSVLPDGLDIRGAFTKVLQEETADTMFNEDPELAAAYKEALGMLSDKQKKELSKGPLMETAYGKWHAYHLDTAFNFIRKNPKFAATINKNLENKKTDQEITKDLNNMISSALRQTLNLDHQQKLKRAGDLWGAMGITPSIRGPLGNTIFFGSKTFNPETDAEGNPVEDRVLYETAEGVISGKAGTVGASTAGKPITKLSRDETGQIVPREQRVGAVIPNQFPVLTVQHIDAAVMADTILRVNAERGNKVPLHMIPVHDAIITDVSSVDQYHKQINKSFVDINKGYNIAEEVQKALNRTIREWSSSINDNQNYNVHPAHGDYRALYALIEQQAERNEEAYQEGKRVSEANKSIVALARKIGIRPIGNNIDQRNPVKGSDLKLLMKQLDVKLGATRKLGSWRKAIKENQTANWKEIKDKTYQYN